MNVRGGQTSRLRGLAISVAAGALLTSATGLGQQETIELPPPELTYEVYVDSTVSRAAVRLCFEEGRPDVLVPWRSRDGSGITGAVDSRGRPLPIEQGGRVDVSRAEGCVTYDVDLTNPRRRSEFSRRVGDDLLIGQDILLWVPEGSRAQLTASLTFSLPDGLTAHAPWPREDDVYRLDPTAFVRFAFVAVGTPEVSTVSVDDTEIEIVRLGDGWTVSSEALQGWVQDAVHGVASVTGGLPEEQLTIFLAPATSESIRYGMVRRGGGTSMMFQVGRAADPESLRRSWVTSHEYSHLIHPPLPREDAWLYEGLATYYQEVLRARRGLITEEEAWANLIEGFRRGRRNATQRTLREESREMWRTGRFPRVYWAGTAFVLDADVRMRSARDDATSLDMVLADNLEAWSDQRVGWRSGSLLTRFDETLPQPLLMPMRARYIEQRRFPDTNHVLAQLGVWERRGRVRLRDDAPLAGVRNAIMRPISSVMPAL